MGAGKNTDLPILQTKVVSSIPGRSFQSQEETPRRELTQREVDPGRGRLPRGRRPHPTQYLH